MCANRTPPPFRSRDLRNGNKNPQETLSIRTIQSDTGAVRGVVWNIVVCEWLKCSECLVRDRKLVFYLCNTIIL